VFVQINQFSRFFGAGDRCADNSIGGSNKSNDGTVVIWVRFAIE